MRPILWLVLIVLLTLATGLLWGTGLLQAFLWWLARQVLVVQDLLAERILALRRNEPAAFRMLVALCWAYGFLHAVGPGHGKMLVAGGAAATRLSAWRMSLIALAGSLGQALFAILLVYGSLALFAGSARGTVAASEGWVAVLGDAAVIAIGGWIVLRGMLRLRAALADPGAPGHEPDHAPGCGCGHAHFPDPAAVADARDARTALLLVIGMAARPCTGALVVLIIAWRLGLPWAGIAGVMAMGLGTATVTALIGLLAVRGRDTAFLVASESPVARIAAPALQILAGGAILLAGVAVFEASLMRI